MGRNSGGVDWRQKLDTQRGAVLANELKNNACKLAKWTVQSILAGADNLKFGYVTRYNVKDSSRHVILGTQQFKPIEFGQQINLSMDNAWGIVRCVLDLVMAQKDGRHFGGRVSRLLKKEDFFPGFGEILYDSHIVL